jgi:hypothetical protein
MTENELLDELANELYLSPVGSNEVTAETLASRLNVSSRQAMAILKEKEANGELKSRWARGIRKTRVLAFSKI